MGLLIGFLCFQWQQMAGLVFIVSVSYGLLHLVPATHTQMYTFVWAMGSLSVAHIYRMFTDYGGYQMDFTGPLMIMVQKITLVAFALHDGKGRPDSELNADQRAQKIVVVPGLLEYFGLMFSFHSLLAGPICTIKDYTAFMDGSNFRMASHPHRVKFSKELEPSALYPVISKLLCSVLSLCFFITLSNYVDSTVMLDPQYTQPWRLIINHANAVRIRSRYYFGWLLAESVNNLAGLGFSGYDEKGMAKWDLLTNLYIWEIELGTSMRTVINKWNALSSLWLRRCVYERSPFLPTFMTFVVSAWWHGFYPGYYFTFVYLALVLGAARKMRSLVRPYFQGSPMLLNTYHVITWLFTHVYLDYALSFDLMLVDKSLTYWSYYFYIPLITSFVVFVAFPSGKHHKSEQSNNEAQPAPADEEKTN